MPEPWRERRRQYLEFADRLEIWKDLQFERDTLSGLVEMLQAGAIRGAARNGSKLAVWTEHGFTENGLDRSRGTGEGMAGATTQSQRSECMKATKSELQTEIQKLRNIGAQMANACFNLSQSQLLHEDDKKLLGELTRQWDSIRRSEKPQ